MKYDVSALITQYNPDYNKLFYTINSFVLQKNVKLQIVVTDDGSQKNYFEEIKKYFNRINFADYVLTKNEYNKGTVKNVINGLRFCEGEYIKDLSPGDCMYDENSLRNMIDYMKVNGFAGIGSDYVCCKYQDGNILKVDAEIRPRLTDLKGDDFAINYLFSSDNYLGAALFAERNMYEKYYPIIANRIKYSEECFFRLMVYKKEKIGYYKKPTIIYEYGTGISSGKNKYWNNVCNNDIREFNFILKELNTDYLKKYLYWRIKIQKLPRVLQILSLFKNFKMLLLRVKIEMSHRKCNETINSLWIKKIKVINE